jgi:hypothetical protein
LLSGRKVEVGGKGERARRSKGEKSIKNLHARRIIKKKYFEKKSKEHVRYTVPPN